MAVTTEVIKAVTTEAMVTMVIFALKNANVTMMTKTAGMFASNAGKRPKEIKATMMVLTTVPTKASSLELIANVNAHTKTLLAGRPAMSASIVSSAKMMTTVMKKTTTAAMVTMEVTMAATMVATMAATMAATMEATMVAMATTVVTMVAKEAMVTTATFVLKNANVTMMMKTAGMFASNAGKKPREIKAMMVIMAVTTEAMANTAINASTSATAITMMKTAGMAATIAGKKLTAVMTAAGGKNQNVQSPHVMTIANGGMKNVGKSTIGVSESSELWLDCHNS